MDIPLLTDEEAHQSAWARLDTSAYHFSKQALLSLGIGIATLSILFGSLSGVLIQTKRHERSVIPSSSLLSKTFENTSAITYSPEILAFADEVALTIKTGAAVFFSRLPTHLLDEAGSNSIIKNRIYVADFASEIAGIQVEDVLSNVTEQVSKDKDFQAYHTLHEQMADGNALTNAPRGWDLDKFKFLPLHGLAYRKYPEAKFTIHIEADTYLIQEGLLRWLKTLDHTAQLYIGAYFLINDRGFAQGGAGYVLSQGLLKATWGKDPYLENRFNDLATKNCCGDFVVAETFRALKGQGVTVDGPNVDTESRFNVEPPREIAFSKENLCREIFTLHHVSAEDSHHLFNMERFVYPKLKPGDFIRHIDVYDWFLPGFLRTTSPSATEIRVNWQNSADDRTIDHDNSDEYDAANCQKRCEEWQECLMWSFRQAKFGEEKECRLGDRVRIGKKSDRHISGWMPSRMKRLRDSQKCADRFVKS